jgi:predicted lipid-binding transport protein (Tim44 family)
LFGIAAALLGAALIGALVLWFAAKRPDPERRAPVPPPATPAPSPVVRAPEIELERPVQAEPAAPVGPAAAAPVAPAVAEQPAATAKLDQSEMDQLLVQDPSAALAKVMAATPADDAEAQRLRLLEVRALVALKEISSARAQAQDYYQRWPDGPDVAYLERLTGLHPTPPR